MGRELQEAEGALGKVGAGESKQCPHRTKGLKGFKVRAQADVPPTGDSTEEG